MSHDVMAGIESKRPLMLRLSKVFADPLRIKVLAECTTREMSPASFQEEFGGPLNRVSRAFDVLVQYEWLERVEDDDGGQPGEAEPFYRAADVAVFDETTWPELPGPMKSLVTARIFESLAERVNEAEESGTIDGRDDQHLSWTPLALDQLGWETVISRIDALFYSLSREQKDAQARMAESGEEPIPMTVGLLGFESPQRPGRR